MIEYLSPAVAAAILRVSSMPVFSVRLAMAWLLTLSDVSDGMASAAQHDAPPREGANHV
jgi:hypothetical protein